MKDRLPIAQPPALHVIMPLSPAQQTLALLLADELRANGLSCDIVFEGSMKSMMRKASSSGAAYALIIGEEEQQYRTVMVKNMVTGVEQAVAQADVVKFLKK